MAEKLLKAQKQGIQSLELIPSDGGKFEIFVDNKEIYSKLKAGQFPEENEILKHVAARS